ncbi:MAG: tetratricopeptide repeat protein [Chloroflexi bacterium]|nr:tetratricopeptide repeat protein [Chloroflexota bacterium]
MNAPAAGKPLSPEKLERELLARLGLDPSASPEDLAIAHEAVAAYLAAAPHQLRAWARHQAAGADEAYALLTDPAALARAVALVGASARPTVVPGGSATPPAPGDTPVPAAAAVSAAAARPAARPKPRVDEDGRRIVSDDELDALLAEVDPGAHREVVGTAAERARAAGRLEDAAPERAPRGSRLVGILGSPAFRNLALVGATVAAIAVVAVVGFNAGGAGTAIGANAGATASPAASAAVLDEAAVAALMGKIQANPKDADALMGLGDEYYKVGDYATASEWFTKVTKVEPTAVRGFLALGASAFNQGDMAAAEAAWKQAVAIDATNVEAHYDLGFLYLNRQPADMAGVQREWGRVVELSPDSEIAKTVKAHLDALASFAPGSPAPSGAPAASPAASPAPSAAPSADPGASPAPSASPRP